MTKPNPRWERAPVELHWIGEPKFVEAMTNRETPYRFANFKDADVGKAIPPFLVEQPDGTWAESFFREQVSASV